VKDPAGFFLGMAGWAIEVQALAGNAIAAMEASGHIRIDVWTFVDDTDAVAEMPLHVCHGAQAMGPRAYRRWRAGSFGTRNARHGGWVDPYLQVGHRAA
jgi:hypothetical protein